MSAPCAVLAMAYGSPATPADIEAFYTDVRRGRAPSPEQLAELTRRYDAIGGVSPLRERTEAQVAAIQVALDERRPGRYVAHYGAKHAHPKIEEALEEIAAQGSTRVVGLVLAPHYSSASIGEYLGRAARRADELGLEHRFVSRFGAEPEFVSLLGARVTSALRHVSEHARRPEVVFSAHSLPARIIEHGDPYPHELAETARLVAQAVGLSHHRTAWQSAGRTPEPWLGPDLSVVLEAIRSEGYDAVLVVPAGFTSDHLEVLYDLDIEASARAGALGLAFARTESLNADPDFAAMLARLVIEADERDGPPTDGRR